MHLPRQKMPVPPGQQMDPANMGPPRPMSYIWYVSWVFLSNLESSRMLIQITLVCLTLTFVSCFDTARTCSCAVIHSTVGVGFWQADNQSRSQQETRRRSHMLPTDVELDACTHMNKIAGCYRTVLLKAPGQTVPKRYNTLFMHVVETNVHYRAHYIRVGGLSFDNCTVV